MREFDPWKSPLCTCPKKYSLHPYTGCSHFCTYCYATSYIGLRESKAKQGFLERLVRDLSRVEEGALVEMSTSSDPYPPLEEKVCLTRRSLELLSRYNVRVLITTKSDLVVRDAHVLTRLPSAVMITITTLDEKLAALIEPGAPSPTRRLSAIRELVAHGIPVGVRVDPVIPHVNDDHYVLEELVGKVAEAGALHLVTSTYKAKWDSLRRLERSLPDVGQKISKLYREKGARIHGYMYLPVSTRRVLLEPVVKSARNHGLTYATCREGLNGEFRRAPSCDGSHLTKLLNRQ